MAAVNYNIKGKHDDKGIKAALSSFKKLESQVKSINNTVKGLMIFKVLEGVQRVSNATKEIFINQNEALVKFNTAVSKTNLNLSKLQAMQVKLSRNNFFDGDSINNAMTLGVQMGLTEEQLEKVMTAATDMAASGIMPLDTAVKALSLTYSGNVTQLKKIAPELDNLTKNEIKNGAAVDTLLEKYSGFSDSITNTFSGRNTQWNNSLDDLKAAVGSIPESLKFITEGKLLEPLNKVTEWIVKNRDYVLNFFINLPEIARIAFKTIQDGLKKLFSKDGLDSIVKAITDSCVNVSSAVLSIFSEVVKGVVQMIKEFCTNLETGDIGTLLLNAWYKICNQLNEMFFKVFDVAAELLNGNVKDAISVAMGTKRGKIADSLHYDYKEVDTTAAVQAVVKVVNDMGKNISGIANGLVEDQKGVVIDFLDQFQGIGEDAFNEIKDILGKELPDDLKKALAGVTYNGNGTGTGGSGGGTGSGLSSDNKKSILNTFGQIGGYISAFQENGWTGVIIKLLGDIVSQASQISSIVNNVLNAVNYLIGTVISPLLDLLEPILNPILQIIKSIGTMIGAFLPLLTPIFACIANLFEAISKVIFWISTFFTSLFDTVRYGFIEVYNYLAKIYNAVNAWWDDDIEYKKQNKTWDTIADQWASLVNAEKFNAAYQAQYDYSLTSSAASSSSGASYTAAKDIIVNVNYNNSYVNGDAREIAVSIYNEIKSAERMGYIS